MARTHLVLGSRSPAFPAVTSRRLLNRDIVVQGNPRVYKALRDQLAAVLGELRRMEAGGGPMGLDSLTTSKFVVRGQGQTRG